MSQIKTAQRVIRESEKLALVGRIAASAAHSIRNPLTSVKMRLFSMERTLDLSATQQEDFDVISEEIRHIDSIVQNFLRFSRLPKPRMQRINPSDVVDMSLQLVRYRLESYDVEVKLCRQDRLPDIVADVDQLKEVLVNLLVNAREAMGSGGRIVISEEEDTMESLGRVVVIRVSDNGPGIPEEIQGKLFEPFFSTKEEGTGLGLSIAARILEEHGGLLNVRSQEGNGATFTITLPCTEESIGNDPDR
jgi:signal transduction histidine kinase